MRNRIPKVTLKIFTRHVGRRPSFGFLWLLFILMVSCPAWGESEIPDAGMTYWVKQALQHDPRVDSLHIQVFTDKGIVTLSGTVPSLASKSYAVKEAKKTRGVMGVIDLIRFMPEWRSDRDIEHEVRRKILNSAVIDSQGIQVTSFEGKVRLEGTVPNWEELDEAQRVASEVRGVKEIENMLIIDMSITRTDQDIKADVVSALERNVYLTDLPITVSVKEGMVTLEGAVASPYEKDLAREIVKKMSQVVRVENYLLIEPWMDPGARKKVLGLSQDQLHTRVHAELHQDNRIKDDGIDLRVSNGTVTLDGTVPTLHQKQLAEEDARNVVGVGWVINYLVVKGDTIEDWVVADNVRYELHTDYALRGAPLKVEIRSGVVTLSGTAHSLWEHDHAKEVASRVAGVREVLNEIRVSFDQTYSDARLTKEIHTHLKWNWRTFWNHNDIQVKVQNGVATLTGHAAWWAERQEAGKIAYNTNGIWLVDNRLKVAGYGYPWEEWYYNGDYHTKPPAEYGEVYRLQ